MLRSLILALVTLLLTVGPVATGLAADLGVITGSEKGTYYQFGLNLQALGKSNGFNVAVHPSKGSVENVYAVYQRPGVPMGIVQSDVLAFVARVQTDQTLKRIAKKIKLVFPLYNEEIHLLARRGVVSSFDDLADKRVAIGRDGSGTYLTTPASVQAVGRRAARDGPDRHRRGARRAEGGQDRRDVLRRGPAGTTAGGRGDGGRRPRAGANHQQGHRRVLS